MDEQAALIARRVAMAAAAWFNAPADVEAYRRLAGAVGEWNGYCAPRLHEAEEELLDALGDDSAPQPLAGSMAELEVVLRRAMREQL